MPFWYDIVYGETMERFIVELKLSLIIFDTSTIYFYILHLPEVA